MWPTVDIFFFACLVFNPFPHLGGVPITDVLVEVRGTKRALSLF